MKALPRVVRAIIAAIVASVIISIFKYFGIAGGLPVFVIASIVFAIFKVNRKSFEESNLDKPLPARIAYCNQCGARLPFIGEYCNQCGAKKATEADINSELKEGQ